MIPILAEIEGQGLEVLLYLLLGAALLVLSVVILRLVQENGYRLILLALLTATVGIGFDVFLSELPVMRSGTLMRIAFIVALCGVGNLLLSPKQSSSAVAPRKRKGAKDAE